MTVQFNATREERKTITLIVDRAAKGGWCRGPKERDHWYDALTMAMDLNACHSNGCPMDFKRMLAADDLDFLHDVSGIARHMDRETGKLKDCFLPRFAKRD